MANQLFENFATRYFYKFLILCGLVWFILSFFLGPQEAVFSGYRLMATGVIFLGIGEWLNHPLQVSLELPSKASPEARRQKHRKRNPSTLGNLFEIIALLLICVGISKVFFT